MTSEGGWPIWQGTFLPFGQEWNPQITINHYKFTGDEHDDESNLEHTQFRQLSSVQGRWLSPDPYLGSMDLTNPQSLNRYAYVLNNPLLFTDPSGLVCSWNLTDGGTRDTFYPGEALFLNLFTLGMTCFDQHSDDRCPHVKGGCGGDPPPPPPPAPPKPPAPRTCVGGLAGLKGGSRALAGNERLIGKPGAFDPVTVESGTAAVIPRQFGFPSDSVGRQRMSVFTSLITGVVGDQSFTSVTDVVGGKSPAGCKQNVRDCLLKGNPNNFIAEIV